MVDLRATEWLGEPAGEFLADSFGIATSDILVGYVRQVGFGVQDTILQAIAGVAIVKWGHKAHPLLKNYGKGVLHQLAAGLIRGSILGGVGAAGAGGQVATSNVFAGA